jgi:hypothetical protein
VVSLTLSPESWLNPPFLSSCSELWPSTTSHSPWCIFHELLLQNPSHPSHPDSPLFPALPVLFAEEPGLVLEVQEADVAGVRQRYESAGLRCLELGHTGEAGPQAMVRKPGRM